MERAQLAEALRVWGVEHGHRFPETGRALDAGGFIFEARSEKFMTAFARAVAGETEIFLGDPFWGESERTQAMAIRRSVATRFVSIPRDPNRGFLMIPTGGTSGQVRFARHDGRTIAAAVQGFSRHFSLAKINSVGVLPLHHVSGLMPWMRAVLTGGEYRPVGWKEIESGARPQLPPQADGWTISLVPTQLERLLRDPTAVEWLRQFRFIFLGGGPAWPELLDRAAELKLPISPGYGMTETAAMVTALLPGDFLAGARDCGLVLPHVSLRLGDNDAVTLRGDSLFRGYYPDWRDDEAFVTEDGGRLDERGHLYLTGRLDAVIITGGEKVAPAEVEAVLRGTGEFREVVVVGVPDGEWGRKIVAGYPAHETPNLGRVTEAVNRLLAPAKRPKHYIAIASWPAKTQGKVNRAEVMRLVQMAQTGRDFVAG